jgi:hypothetical protein
MRKPSARQRKERKVSEVKEQWKEQGAVVPMAKSSALAMNGSSPVGAYLAQHAVGTSGTFIKFAKDGVYRRQIDGAEIPKGTEAVLIYDQIRVGWIKFTGKGNQPIRQIGPVFDGYVPPDRDSLGETDEANWEVGLSGRPTDPWQFQILIPLQDAKTGELLIFGTSSITGRRACDSMISTCARMQRAEPNYYPIVRLDVSGFEHRDERIGWVKTPSFICIGKALKADVSVTVTGAEEMSDSIPF